MDVRTYASALREVCFAELIKIVGLADHGSITDSENVRKVLSAAGYRDLPEVRNSYHREGPLGMSLFGRYERTAT